jgi:translation elongation factor EF-4
MKEFGSVQIPQETFIDVLKTDADGWLTGIF